MRVKQYGHIRPKEKKCDGCGAVLEYCEPDVKKRFTHDRYRPDSTEKYVNCPVCGNGVILPEWEDEEEEE